MNIVQLNPSLAERRCGECTLCCKLIDVPTLNKRAGTQCKHATKCDGCGIYEERPTVCKSFSCLWKESVPMGFDLRPDQCGVVFELYKEERTVVALVDEGRDWNTGETKLLISRMNYDGYVVWIVEANRKHLILPDKVTEHQAVELAKKAYRRKMVA